MTETFRTLFADSFLVSAFAAEYQDYLKSEDTALLDMLKKWADKEKQTETEAENAFINIFFKQIWGYTASGETERTEGYTCYPQFSVPKAGEKGGTGKADLALGWFGREEAGYGIPQVLCEFKDIRSGLDNEQPRKGNRRSPVRQCVDYLREANNAFAPYGHEPIRAKWAIVTDMNEFRLYSWQSIPHHYQKFVIRPSVAETAIPLISDSEEAAFQRFLFRKLFQASMLLGTGGPCELEKLLKEQLVHEKELEKDFYREYHAYRETVFAMLVKANPDFGGTRGKLVRLTQRLLDRCLFILFCEDMGAALSFPPNLLRDFLIRHSMDDFYDPADNAAWEKVKKLFAAMRDGTPFLKHPINRFNGGLFAEEPELENLNIPTILFCGPQQGMNESTLFSRIDTLLYLSAQYNFGPKGAAAERSIGLYTLGRIFEQSITDLEFMEARADGRISLTELSKRKRDGVYYTPEWVTDYIVEETVGQRLSDIRTELGFNTIPPVTDEHIALYLSRKKTDRKKATHVADYLVLLEKYAAAMNGLRVVDPACGSGAFLIQAFERLLRERKWIAGEKERIERKKSLFDMEQEMKAILSDNLFGVDINSESVEITRLSLWLRTALPDKPLGVLDNNIICGNSLVGPDFYEKDRYLLFPEEKKEQINVFDWRTAFPQAFENGGFDCVIGNPPYIKLQHFRQAMPEVTEYLLSATKADGTPRYESARTGNFDMYLPFIETGVELLNEKGRMGYIAPNVWLMNEYGKGLRNRLKQSRRMDRWIDFKSFQVFDEAITYTALQFFRGTACDAIKCRFAPDGNISDVDWNAADEDSVAYDELPEDTAWNLLPDTERKLAEKLNRECRPLEACCRGITVGIQTSADYIYHLTKIAPGKYLHRRKDKKNVETEIEDELMRPLVSGTEAKRYQVPATDTYLLFPYDLSGERPRLWTENEMSEKFSKAWTYLKGYEKELRDREGGKFDDNEWHRFGRNQNIDKQEFAKMGVAQTVPGMRVFYDKNGEFFFNNVRVNGILPVTENDGWFLLAILNSPTINFVFKRTAKDKEGGFYEANKQFIAPLPIPDADESQKKQVGELAEILQTLHTQRRDKMLLIDRRLRSAQTEADKRKPQWIWVDAKNSEALEKRLETLDAYLRPGAGMSAENDNGELKFLIGGAAVIDGVFEDGEDADFIAAQWNHIARATNITEKFTAKKLVNLLCNLRKTDNLAIKKQVAGLDAEIRELDRIIAEKENEINVLVYLLYKLTPEEIRLVEES